MGIFNCGTFQLQPMGSESFVLRTGFNHDLFQLNCDRKRISRDHRESTAKMLNELVQYLDDRKNSAAGK